MASSERAVTIRNWYPRFLASGCDFNDVERILAASDDWARWPGLWGETAETYARLAEAGGTKPTRARLYRLASLYAHFGQFMAFGAPEERDALHARSVEWSRRSLALLPGRWRRLEIPFDGGCLYANLRVPPGPEARPVVVLLPGLDSIKEELASMEDLLLERGLATLALEGPGQGEARRHGGWRLEHERAVAAALDALRGEPGTDLERVGVAGRSFGGYLAGRAAALLPRIRACVVIGGTSDLAPWESLQPIIRRDFQEFCQVATEAEAARIAAQVSLPPIPAPLLVVHGGRDTIFPPEQARRVLDAARGPRELLFYEDGNHVCENYAPRCRPAVADWLALRLTGP